MQGQGAGIPRPNPGGWTGGLCRGPAVAGAAAMRVAEAEVDVERDAAAEGST